MVTHSVPRPSGRQGAALHVVLAVVAILMLLASSMVALSTMSLNLLNSYHNGQVAQNEADTGLARLLYALADQRAFGENRVDEIRGCVTPGFADPESYHYVTFNPSKGFPHSVNNTNGGTPNGYAGRSIPSRMIHAFVTGHCRGQYRTIEVLLEQPPYPFAVASSGRIRSSGPLIAQGTSSTEKFLANDLSRPGNVASNSTSRDGTNPAVYIGADPNRPDLQTLITGFVQSSGMVMIKQPAVVKGGIRPTTDAVKLPDIDVTRFDNTKPDPDTGLKPEGVVEISPKTFGAQTLDVTYHCSHDLTYTGNLTLDNAFLYVKGDLNIQGGVKGTGAIVVDGNVTVEGDTSLEADNRVALVVSGDATLKGNGNFFQGLVYSKGNLTASHVTVVGNMVVNSKDPGKGSTGLEQVRLVDNPQAASLKFTVVSSKKATSQQTNGDRPFRIGPILKDKDDPSQGYTPGFEGQNDAGDADHGADGWFSEPDARKYIYEMLVPKDSTAVAGAMTSLNFGDLGNARSRCSDAGDVWKAYDAIQKGAETYKANLERLAAYDTWTKMPEPKQSGPPAGISSDAERDAVVAENLALVTEYPKLVGELANAYMNYYESHASATGTFKKPGKIIERVEKTYDFDLNQFLPQAQRLKMKYWHVSYQRL